MIILLGLIILFYFILHHTKFGRYLFLIEMAPEGARSRDPHRQSRRDHLRHQWNRCGLCRNHACFLLYIRSKRPGGRCTPSRSLPAPSLGVRASYGGTGSIIGTTLASLLIGYLKYGLQMIKITSHQTNVFLGIVLIVSISGRYFWGQMSSRHKNKMALKHEKLL